MDNDIKLRREGVVITVDMLFFMVGPNKGKIDEMVVEYAACLQKMENCSAAFSRKTQNALT